MKKIIKLTLSISLLVIPFIAFAQNTTPSATIYIPNPTNAGSSLLQVLNTLLRDVIMPIAAIAVVMYIIWAGFSFVTAQGNPKKIGEAQQRLLWALIGAGILLGAAGISLVVERTVRALLVP